MNQNSRLIILESCLPKGLIHPDDWKIMKNSSSELIQMLEGYHIRYADSQIPDDFEGKINTFTTETFSLYNQFPKIFSKFNCICFLEHR